LAIVVFYCDNASEIEIYYPVNNDYSSCDHLFKAEAVVQKLQFSCCYNHLFPAIEVGS